MGKLAYTQAASAGELRATKAMFKSRVNTLVNAITANAAHAQRGIRHLTKVARNWKHADAADRKLIRVQRSAMKANLDKALARVIQLGEARAKAVEERANENIASTKKALSSQTAVSLSTVKAKPAAGEGFGSNKIPLIFSGKNVKINGAISKINGLVNEYIKTIGQVRARWPMGLGKYLMAKLETAMQSTGALEVDKVADKAGNYVFVNGHAVGLSSKLSDFASLAVRMTAYEHTPARLTGKLSNKKHAGKVMVKPPEWQGN